MDDRDHGWQGFAGGEQVLARLEARLLAGAGSEAERDALARSFAARRRPVVRSKDAQMALRLSEGEELFDTGVRMLEQRLRREQPGASDMTIRQALARWLADRPGAEAGDADGRAAIDRLRGEHRGNA